MPTQSHDLTPTQLDWCRKHMPSFRAANDAVLRMRKDVAANRERAAAGFARLHTYPPEGHIRANS